ncbi:MAG: hypothetical protein J0I06_28635 [Planctomycetes bacterium]|nr:hypothetical protein [Planctomycetota bacterium]
MGDYGLGYEQDGSRIVVRDASGSVLVTTFDGQNRLASLEAEVRAADEQPVESWEQAQITRLLRG